DAFSALDAITDARVRAALRERAGGTSTVVVAQRIATIAEADQIIVLSAGRIAGIGRHEELRRTCPEYREILSSQGEDTPESTAAGSEAELREPGVELAAQEGQRS
ncbi:hypothetical protein OOT08_03320, partial [Leucobacter sp. M11]|nr:hypothetical protein [Leucobacter sp. M11]